MRKKFKVTVSALTSRKAETLWKDRAHTRQLLWGMVMAESFDWFILLSQGTSCLCPWHQIALHVKFKVFRQGLAFNVSPAPKHTQSLHFGAHVAFVGLPSNNFLWLAEFLL